MRKLGLVSVVCVCVWIAGCSHPVEASRGETGSPEGKADDLGDPGQSDPGRPPGAVEPGIIPAPNDPGMTCELEDARTLAQIAPIEIGPGRGEPEPEHAQVSFVANPNGAGAQRFTMILGDKQLAVVRPTRSVYTLREGEAELTCYVAVGAEIVPPTRDSVSCQAISPTEDGEDEHPEVFITHGSDYEEPGLDWAEAANHRFAATFVEGSGSQLMLRLDRATSVNMPIGDATSLSLSAASVNGRRASLDCTAGVLPSTP